MGGDPAAPAQTSGPTRFSADGFWWWDGAQWRPAMSEDRLWRWTGSTWEPARPGGAATPGSRSGSTVGIVIGALVGVVVLVAVVAIAVIYFAGPQISNVFSNLVTTPSSP